MPLATAKPTLEIEIYGVLMQLQAEAAAAGEKGLSASEINQKLAKGLTDAIHSYATQAAVDITSIVSAVAGAVPVATAGSPAAHVGTTTGPIVTQHAGFGSLK